MENKDNIHKYNYKYNKKEKRIEITEHCMGHTVIMTFPTTGKTLQNCLENLIRSHLNDTE